MTAVTTTLNAIHDHGPCTDGWEKLLSHLDKTSYDDDPLALTEILDSNGLEDCLWCLRVVPKHNNLWRRYAVWCARQVEHLIADPHSRNALDVADRHWQGLATDGELAAAWAAAWAAAGAAAGAAAWAAAEAAAGDAAGDAARAAAEAAAGDAAGDAARDAQSAKLRAILDAGEWV